LQTRIRRSREFLKDGDRVRITIYLRGREIVRPEIAFEKIEKIEEGLSDVGRMEKKPEKKGRFVTATFVRK
jgi:translation initiation factor IF-3